MTGVLRWLADHVWVPAAAPTGAGTVWLVRDGRGPAVAMLLVTVLVVLACVAVARPEWARFVRDSAASWRRERWYRRRWVRAMQWAGLADAGAPELVAHRFAGEHLERDLDVLTVQLPAGHTLRSVPDGAEKMLAAALGLRRVRMVTVLGRPGQLQVFGSRFMQPAPARHAVPVPSLTAAGDASRAARGPIHTRRWT